MTKTILTALFHELVEQLPEKIYALNDYIVLADELTHHTIRVTKNKITVITSPCKMPHSYATMFYVNYDDPDMLDKIIRHIKS